MASICGVASRLFGAGVQCNRTPVSTLWPIIGCSGALPRAPPSQALWQCAALLPLTWCAPSDASAASGTSRAVLLLFFGGADQRAQRAGPAARGIGRACSPDQRPRGWPAARDGTRRAWPPQRTARGELARTWGSAGKRACERSERGRAPELMARQRTALRDCRRVGRQGISATWFSSASESGHRARWTPDPA